MNLSIFPWSAMILGNYFSKSFAMILWIWLVHIIMYLISNFILIFFWLHWWLGLLILLIFSNNQCFVFSLCCLKNLLFFNFCSDLYTFLKIRFIFIYVFLCACLCKSMPCVYRCIWRTKENIGFPQPGNIYIHKEPVGEVVV